jgi:hypothetical protein
MAKLGSPDLGCVRASAIAISTFIASRGTNGLNGQAAQGAAIP